MLPSQRSWLTAVNYGEASTDTDVALDPAGEQRLGPARHTAPSADAHLLYDGAAGGMLSDHADAIRKGFTRRVGRQTFPTSDQGAVSGLGSSLYFS